MKGARALWLKTRAVGSHLLQLWHTNILPAQEARAWILFHNGHRSTRKKNATASNAIAHKGKSSHQLSSTEGQWDERECNKKTFFIMQPALCEQPYASRLAKKTKRKWRGHYKRQQQRHHKQYNSSLLQWPLSHKNKKVHDGNCRMLMDCAVNTWTIYC